MTRTITIMAIMAALCLQVRADAETLQRVYLQVGGDNKIKSVVESGLLRRLREFKDVEIAYSEDQADDSFHIIATALHNSNGPTGYALSVVYSSKQPLSLISTLAHRRPENKGLGDLIDTLTKGLSVYRDVALYVGGELEPQLNSVVADIDVDVLEPWRKMKSLQVQSAQGAQ
jgi:hypothetical protein